MKASSHDKINLARLLTRLDKLVHHSAEPLKDRPWWEVRKLNDVSPALAASSSLSPSSRS